jgi:hypothetical protein
MLPFVDRQRDAVDHVGAVRVREPQIFDAR